MNKYFIHTVLKCNGNCNNISNQYSRVCIPDIIKNVTLKVFDLMSWTNKTKTNKMTSKL